MMKWKNSFFTTFYDGTFTPDSAKRHIPEIVTFAELLGIRIDDTYEYVQKAKSEDEQ